MVTWLAETCRFSRFRKRSEELVQSPRLKSSCLCKHPRGSRFGTIVIGFLIIHVCYILVAFVLLLHGRTKEQAIVLRTLVAN